MNIGYIHQELNKALLKIHFPYEKGLLKREILIHHSGKWLWEKYFKTSQKVKVQILSWQAPCWICIPFRAYGMRCSSGATAGSTWRSLQGELRLRGDWLQINLEGEDEGNTAFPPPWELIAMSSGCGCFKSQSFYRERITQPSGFSVQWIIPPPPKQCFEMVFYAVSIWCLT